MKLSFIESSRCTEGDDQPYLTIAIPTWNRCKLLDVQLSAIAPFLSADIELVVCDNGSSDSTWADITSRDTAGHFRFVRNCTNLGADVNYLRAIEAARGRWVWLVGDDDKIDFGLLSKLVDELKAVRATVVLLYNTEDADDRQKTYIPFKDFFAEEYDEFGMHLLHVGRVLCKTAELRSHLRNAYASGIGELHSYAHLYGPLVASGGLYVLPIALMRDRETEPPRWNLLSGSLGAWQSSVKIFGVKSAEAANQREVRLRERGLVAAVMVCLAVDHPISKRDKMAIRRCFSLRGRLAVRLLYIAFGVSPRLARTIFSIVYPPLVAKIAAARATKTEEY